MIERSDIVLVHLSVEELLLAYKAAKMAELGGSSRIREREERLGHLEEDQFIGVGLGELAGNKHWFSVDHYVQARREKNKNPFSGDDGSDTPGYRIDYKSSRAKKANLLSYNLPVRPHERHPDNVYVLILVWTYGRTPKDLVCSPPRPDIYLVGWAFDSDLPLENEKEGIFGPVNRQGGAYLLPAKELRPIATLTVDQISTIENAAYLRK